MRYQIRGPIRAARLDRMARCGSVIDADYPFAFGPVPGAHTALGPSIVIMARGATPAAVRDRHPRRVHQPSLIDVLPESTPGHAVGDDSDTGRGFNEADYADSQIVQRNPGRHRTERMVSQEPPARLRPLLQNVERRIAVFGEFKQILALQLQNPDRLRDNHRLPCHVQVYEATGNATLEQLVHNTFPDRDIRLCRLTELRARRLHLDRRLLRRNGAGPEAAKLYLELRVEADPSADFAGLDHNSEQSASAPRVVKRTAIPRKFTQPWTFSMSRDEAAYDLGLATNGSSLRRYVSQLASNWFSASLRSRWRALLAGKDLDTQLWDVPPPKRGHHHTEVREWLLQTLQQAGYDVATMVHEWEIHWRRRGAI